MAFPSADFTFSCARPLLAQQQYDMDMDITSALFSSDPCLDEYFKDDFDTYFNFTHYDDVQDAESPVSMPSSPSTTDTDSDASYPDTLPLEDDSSFTPSPAISPSLLSSPSVSPASPHAKVPTVIAIEDSDIDAEGETDDGSEFEDSDSDESFDPEELRAVRNRKRAQQSRTVRRGNASSSSKPPRAKQYKSKQSSRRGSRSSKSAPRARSRSSSSTSASRIFDSPIKPRYRYCKPRARQVSVAEYQDWLKDPRAKNFKCPYKCGYSQDRSPDLYRHIDTHHQTARGTAFVCCGVPISELPALLPKDGSVSDYQLYEYQGGLWAGGCFQVISRKDAMLRHWGLHADSETDKKKKKCKCIPTKEMVEINLHEHRLV